MSLNIPLSLREILKTLSRRFENVNCDECIEDVQNDCVFEKEIINLTPMVHVAQLYMSLFVFLCFSFLRNQRLTSGPATNRLGCVISI